MSSRKSPPKTPATCRSKSPAGSPSATPVKSPSNSPPRPQPTASESPSSSRRTRSDAPSETHPRSPSPDPETPRARIPEDAAVDHDDQDSLDNDSTAGTLSSTTVSISSSVLDYRTFYGRTYENIQSTEYWAPNDEQQNEGLDLTHHALLLTLDNRLFLAPIGDHPRRVLDVGTGTGIWAIAFGDDYPEAEITGIDLSPIQPDFVPPNVKFIIEDCLLDWTWPKDYFDFIHIRAMYGSIPDWVELYKKAFAHLAPGGWIQDLEMDVRIQSDHIHLSPIHVFNRWAELFYRGGEKMGRSFGVCRGHTMRDNLEAAGFVDIVEKKIKAPIHSWPEDRNLKQAGRLFHMALEQSIEGYVNLLLMDLLGWYREEVEVLLGLYRQEIRNKSNCGWIETTVVYGRKPFYKDETAATTR